MADASLINIGLSGVRAHQSALSTTGQNITNANTPGYTRQRTNFETQVTAGLGSGVHGVNVAGIQRIYDAAAVNQLRTDTSSFARFEALGQQIAQVDSLLADEASNLNRGFEAFFGALQSAANSPSSLPARQLVLSEAEGLVTRFQSLDGRMRDQLEGVNRQIASEVDSINQLATSIADVNARLGPMNAGDGNTNALLDQRDELLRQLAEKVDISTVQDGELGMNVFVGKGHPLVIGANTTPLRLSETGDVQIATRDGSALAPVNVTGGALGGLVAFRDQTLEPVINELGRLALSFAGTVNEIHGQGLNLRGDYGGTFFADLNSAAAMEGRVLASNQAANRGNLDLSVGVEDPAALTASEYRVSFTEAGTFDVRRESDGTVVASGSVGDSRPVRVSFDGLSLEVGEGSIQAGAQYRIDAAGQGVGDLSVALGDPRDLALASPVSISTGEQNGGSGRIEFESVSDVSDPLFGDGELMPPLLVRFTGENTYEVLDNSDPTNPQPLDPPMWGLPYVPGGQQPLLPADGQQVLVSEGQDSNGLPAAVSQSSDLTPAANGFQAETLRIYQRDPQLGSSTLSGEVEITPGMSARAIAAALENVAGVSTAARTEVRISNLQDNGIGEPLTVAVNGEELVLPAGSGVNELADAIAANANLRDAGVSASSDGESLTLTSSRGDDLAIHVSGDVTDGLTVSDPRGRSLDLNGNGPGGDYDTVTVGGSVRLMLDADVRLESESDQPGGGLFSAAPVSLPAAFGFQATVSGRPQAGDEFAIAFNDGGTLDNHNALALAGLQINPSLGDPPASFSETYSSIIEKVGNRTAQVRADTQAAESLLQQSIDRRESISGVNLDEEAANLIRF
ncbi:MAG: flagellar hook-associated protein FlgK, partial [Gammaproteobacteria bacterium]|nr:flagellar hook-associated protein FlgK [Gammaproteobacteria bacterium]